jgi:predicted nucleic acid-binding protein
MSDSDPSHILDASVAIDLIDGDLIEAVAKLPFTIGIPDVILHFELQTYSEYHSGQYSFIEIEFEDTQVIQVTQLKDQTNKVSTPDLFAFLSARHYSCCLITGDNNLRKLATAKGVTVHGVLWLLDVLISEGLLSQAKASDALHRLINGRSRLPKDECIKRFKKWNAPKRYYSNL